MIIRTPPIFRPSACIAKQALQAAPLRGHPGSRLVNPRLSAGAPMTAVAEARTTGKTCVNRILSSLCLPRSALESERLQSVAMRWGSTRMPRQLTRCRHRSRGADVSVDSTAPKGRTSLPVIEPGTLHTFAGGRQELYRSSQREQYARPDIPRVTLLERLCRSRFHSFSVVRRLDPSRWQTRTQSLAVSRSPNLR